MKVYITLALLATLLIAGCVQQQESCTKKDTKLSMNIVEAREIARSSECSKQGSVKTNYMCNEFSGTVWFDFVPNEPKEGCNPACVVNVESRAAEINWRCTGLVEPKK